MSDDFAPDDDLHYEDFDDVGYPEPADDLDVIDLDLVDEAAIETPAAAPPPAATPPAEAAPEPGEPAREAARASAAPEAPAVETEPSAVEARAKPPDAEPESSESPVFTPEDVAPADLIGCVLLALPPDFAAEVQGLREVAGVDDLPPGVVLAGPFRAPDLTTLEDALDGWARAHLPLAVETAGVVAEVIAAQRYVAAWALQPADRLRRASEALRRALEPLIQDADAAPGPAVRLVVGDYVPPDRYPRLIARMQRAFEPQAWQASTVALAQRDVGLPASRWQIVWVSA